MQKPLSISVNTVIKNWTHIVNLKNMQEPTQVKNLMNALSVENVLILKQI